MEGVYATAAAKVTHVIRSAITQAGEALQKAFAGSPCASDAYDNHRIVSQQLQGAAFCGRQT